MRSSSSQQFLIVVFVIVCAIASANSADTSATHTEHDSTMATKQQSDNTQRIDEIQLEIDHIKVSLFIYEY